MSDKRKKHITIFIITLIVLQGIYVVVPLPDIWPIANYSMFSKSKVKTVASKLQIRGVDEEDREVVLNIPEHFYPLDRIRLSKGLSRILDSEKYKERNERRVDQFIEYLDFLPVDKTKLKKSIESKLLYENKFENKEKALETVFAYLSAQYNYNNLNNKNESDAFDKINELRLYRVYWDWTDSQPEDIAPEAKLIYSTKTGLVQDE